MASGGEQQIPPRPSFLVRRAMFRSDFEQSWWMYPVARFFGHALYEYRYDIDFSEATPTNQERNSILYESYCLLLGSLIAKCAKDRGHGTRISDVLMGMISHAFIYPDDKKEGILNLLRAVYGVQQFGCVIMRYCNTFKNMCLEDMKTCINNTNLKMHSFWKEKFDSLSECISDKENFKYFEELQKVLNFSKHHHLPSVISSVPFICEVGIKLNSDINYDDLMHDLQSQFTKAISYMEATKMVKDEKEKSEVRRASVKPKDESKRSQYQDTALDTLAKSVGDIKVKGKSPPKGIKPGETTEKITAPLSPYEAIQGVIEKFKAANEPVPIPLISNLLHLKTEDPYSEYARSKSPKGSSPPSASQSKSTTKGRSPPSAKSLSPSSVSAVQSSALQSKSPKSLSSSPVSATQTSAAVAQSDVVPTSSHRASPPTFKEKSYSPKLTFSSGLFSLDAAKRNRVIVKLPNSDHGRESYVLNEYDCRMKKHIAVQAANFELLNAKKGMPEVSNLVHQQRRLEERWPLRYSETTPSEGFYNENVFDTNVEVWELNMEEMTKESKRIISILQELMCSVDTIKH